MRKRHVQTYDMLTQGVLQAIGTADQQQARMMAYDSTIAALNTARLSGVSYPILQNLMDQTDPVSERIPPDFGHISFYWYSKGIYDLSDISIPCFYCRRVPSGAFGGAHGRVGLQRRHSGEKMGKGIPWGPGKT